MSEKQDGMDRVRRLEATKTKSAVGHLSLVEGDGRSGGRFTLVGVLEIGSHEISLSVVAE